MAAAPCWYAGVPVPTGCAVCTWLGAGAVAVCAGTGLVSVAGTASWATWAGPGGGGPSEDAGLAGLVAKGGGTSLNVTVGLFDFSLSSMSLETWAGGVLLELAGGAS